VSAKRHELPIDFAVRDLKPSNAWRCATVGPGYAAWIKKQNTTAPFVARDVRVPVQENIDIIRRSIRRNVLQSEFQIASHKVDDKRPLEIAVTVSAHNDNRWTDRPQLIKNRFRANIAKMPNLISVFGHLLHAFRQTIVRIRENEHAPSFFGFCGRSHVVF
jgi:hypothetical protein